MEEASVVVIGAGPAGLSAAYHLGSDALLIDQHCRVGGWYPTIERDGFLFDYPGHFLCSLDPDIHELYELLLGDNVHWQTPEVTTYRDGLWERYPLNEPHARFGYPLRGGFQALVDGFLPHLRGQFWRKTHVQAVSAQRHVVGISGEMDVPYDYLISTMPLPELVRLLGDEAPEDVSDAARRLHSLSVRCVHLGVGREDLTEAHWMYFPEGVVFHRIFAQGNASPHCNPPGGFGLTCEIMHAPGWPLPCEGEELIERCVADCRRVGLLKADDPIWTAAQVDLPHAYVMNDGARPRQVALIRDWLAAQDILVAGRCGAWEHCDADHALLAGRKAAEQVRRWQRRTSAGTRLVLPSKEPRYDAFLIHHGHTSPRRS
jgi:protoporphyrinogen oxidase